MTKGFKIITTVALFSGKAAGNVGFAFAFEEHEQ